MTNPIVANWVWFYNKGGGDPIAALVTRANGPILEVNAWPTHAVTPSIHSGVRHRDDPWYKERPERLLENGAWTWPGEGVTPDEGATDEASQVRRIIEDYGSMSNYWNAIDEMLRKSANYSPQAFRKRAGRPRKKLGRPPKATAPEIELPIPGSSQPVEL